MVRTAGGPDARAVGAEAVVFLGAGRPLERIGVPGVVLRPGEALVAVEFVTLCHRDALVLTGAEAVHGPVVLGHEQVGRIVALASLRRPRDIGGRRLVVGDRVVWAAGVADLRYGRDRVRRGWELSGGCATHVQLLARTPVARLTEDAPGLQIAAASCGAVTPAELRAALDPGTEPLVAAEYALRDAELAFAARAGGARVVLRPPALPVTALPVTPLP
jgi:D-arabinose 1-dehydrogenase-like Zn-dependent alcohol dehydrogenase